jgi:hypothetical protein
MAIVIQVNTVLEFVRPGVDWAGLFSLKTNFSMKYANKSR